MNRHPSILSACMLAVAGALASIGEAAQGAATVFRRSSTSWDSMASYASQCRGSAPPAPRTKTKRQRETDARKGGPRKKRRSMTRRERRTMARFEAFMNWPIVQKSHRPGFDSFLSSLSERNAYINARWGPAPFKPWEAKMARRIINEHSIKTRSSKKPVWNGDPFNEKAGDQ